MRASVLVIVLVAACGGHTTGGNGTGVDGGGTVSPPCDQNNDSCPTGTYCLPDGTCGGIGCKTDADCTGGESCCGHACVDENTDPDNCNGCGIACGSGDSCCSGQCTMLDTLTDCGSCGNACASGDFCDGTQCNAPTYPNFCANNQVYVIYDDHTADDHAADVMASTITANCPSTVMVTTASQTDASLVDQTTGQPLAGGGVTYVLGGGPFPSLPLRWLERTDAVTKIYFSAPDGVNFDWMDRSGDVVATMPGSACSAHADQFISELVTDPVSGTLSLIGYGACSGGQGTLAAAWYYANVMLPNATMYPDSWYIVGWSDTDNDSTPSAGDTYTILAHGL